MSKIHKLQNKYDNLTDDCIHQLSLLNHTVGLIRSVVKDLIREIVADNTSTMQATLHDEDYDDEDEDEDDEDEEDYNKSKPVDRKVLASLKQLHEKAKKLRLGRVMKFEGKRLGRHMACVKYQMTCGDIQMIPRDAGKGSRNLTPTSFELEPRMAVNKTYWMWQWYKDGSLTKTSYEYQRRQEAENND